MQSYTPICEDVPKYDPITKYLLGGIIAFTLVIGIIFIPFDMTAAAVMFGLTLFDAILISSVLPRRFQIYEDRFRIALGWPFSVTIFFTNVTNIGVADKDTAWLYTGIKFATSSKFVIEIQRNSGLNIIFSPSKEEEFLDELILAKNNYREPDFSVFLKNG